MRYVIFGAGAIGGTIGGRLFQSGHDVTLIARGEHASAIQSNGLRLRSSDDDVTLQIPCVTEPGDARIGAGDVVVLSMKSQDTDGALDSLIRTAPTDISIVCAQNGVDNERKALRLFERVYGMNTVLPADYRQAGVVAARSAPVTGILDLGRYPQGADDIAAAIANDLEGSTFHARAEAHIMRLKYRKLLTNLGNALDAACGARGLQSPLLQRAQEEALACFAACGIELQSQEEDKARRDDLLSLRPIEGELRGGGSTWQSLARGTGRIESDFLNGEVVLLGRLHGIETPVNAYLQLLSRRMAQQGVAPESLEIETLEAELKV
jgi:2-dehydropantoate 2-reductase